MFNKPAFGATGNTSFGNTSAFGGTSFAGFGNTSFSTPQQSTGLFGASNPVCTGGLFSSNTGGMFAAPTSTSTFGGFGAQQPAAAGGLFGSNSMSTFNSTTSSFFGQQQQQQSQPSSSFMSMTSAPGGGTMFGAGSTFGVQTQTGTIVKLVPVDGTDTVLKNGTNQTIKTKLQCITGMKEYEAKSLEELRIEDYFANRKTGGVGQTTFLGSAASQAPTSAFGAGGLFNTTKSAFSSGFGSLGQTTSTTSSLFGATTRPNLFSNPTTTTPSLFGAAQTGSLFGNTATVKPTFGGFGTTASSAQPTGLFGSTPASTPAFGASNFGATNLTSNTFTNFGQPQQTGSLFAQTSQPSLFGAATSQAGAGLFAAKPLGTAFPSQNTGSLFQTSAPISSFGMFNQNQGSLFGGQNTRPTGTGLFATSSAFGQQPQQSSLFGTSNLGTGLGNASFNATGLGNTGILGGGVGIGNTSLTQNDLANQQFMIQQGLLLLSKYPYGDSPLFNNIKMDPKRKAELIRPTNPVAQQELSKRQISGSLLLNNASSAIKIKTKSLAYLGTRSSQLFDVEKDVGSINDQQMELKDVFRPRTNWKKLEIRSFSSPVATDNDSKENLLNGPNMILADGNETNFNNTIENLYPNLKGLNDDSTSFDGKKTFGQFSNVEYYTVPSQRELVSILEKTDKCVITDFQVGRFNYGNIIFFGSCDISNIDLDATVKIMHKEVEVYPNEKTKPPVGEGLNRPAQITLERIYYLDKSTGQPIKCNERLHAFGFIQRLKTASNKMGAEFVDYHPETGSWIFRVKHFTKYGFYEEDFDECEFLQETKVKLNNNNKFGNIKSTSATDANDIIKHKDKIDLRAGKFLLEHDDDDEDVMNGTCLKKDGIEKSGKMDVGGEIFKGEIKLLLEGDKKLDGDMEEDESYFIQTDNQDDLHSRKKLHIKNDMELENDEDDKDDARYDIYESHKNVGISSRNVQIQKATFFSNDDNDINDNDILHQTNSEHESAEKSFFDMPNDKNMGQFKNGRLSIDLHLRDKKTQQVKEGIVSGALWPLVPSAIHSLKKKKVPTATLR